jgi:hypothetical protein
MWVVLLVVLIGCLRLLPENSGTSCELSHVSYPFVHANLYLVDRDQSKQSNSYDSMGMIALVVP